MKLIFDIHGTKIKRIDDLTLTSYTRNAKCLFHFSWAPKSLQMVTTDMKLKDACSWEEKL